MRMISTIIMIKFISKDKISAQLDFEKEHQQKEKN